jgi:hypothetical protein
VTPHKAGIRLGAAHLLAEVLLLVVCGTMADCHGYDSIAA